MAERRETGRPRRPTRSERPGKPAAASGTPGKRDSEPPRGGTGNTKPPAGGKRQAEAKGPGKRGAGAAKGGTAGNWDTRPPGSKPAGSRTAGPKRPASRPKSAPPGQRAPQRAADGGAGDWSEGERIAKYLARAGVGSRRDVEALIEAGKVSVDGQRLHSPAVKVTGRERIRVGRKSIRPPEPTRLWRYHKPAGLITTNVDPAGRPTIFSQLPKDLPRTVTIGRLDLNTEGLLLLTNDGALARALELPGHAFERRYRARAYGRVDEGKLDQLRAGITVDGERFGAIEAVLEQETGANNWLAVSLAEGKKREVRRALDAVGLMVNRLIRVQYGPFHLAELRPGAVEEVPAERLRETLQPLLPDFRFHDADPEPARPAKPRRTPPTSRFRKRR